MEFSNELEEYEKNVQNILSDGFKTLIDSVNDILSQLLQSTITSAENVENGIKREFEALVTNIENTKVLEELNENINTAEVEEDPARDAFAAYNSSYTAADKISS